MLPEEADLLKEIAALKEQLTVCEQDSQKKILRKTIEDRLLKFNVMMERKKQRMH